MDKIKKCKLILTGFDGDFALHVKNETVCQMVFTSADLKSAKKHEDIKFNLWSADYCEFNRWLYHPLDYKDKEWEKHFRKLPTIDMAVQHSYQGEPAFSPKGAEVAFVQGMPSAESK
jgi:hypothetical protein